MFVNLYFIPSSATKSVIHIQENKTDQISNQGNAGILQEEINQLEDRSSILVTISIALSGLVAFMIYQRAHAQKKYRRMIEDKDDLIRKQKENLELAKLELEIRMLKAQLNPDLLRNSLDSIQKLINQKKSDEALIYISDLSSLIEKILPGTIKLNNSLEEEIYILKSYIDLESARFNGSFTYKINVDEKLDKSAIRVPTMLLQPLVENVLQPGSSNEGEKKNIAICFSEDDNLLQCEISDHISTGNSSKKLNGVESRYAKSQAVKISEQRIRLIAKKYQVEAIIQYQNLSDDKGLFCGRSINIHLPIIQET